MMTPANPRSRTPIRFTNFEFATILVMAVLHNLALLGQQTLMRTFELAPGPEAIIGNAISYALWGLTVALALCIARRDGTATFFMMVNGFLFAFIRGEGILWAFGFVLAGVVIDTYVSGRRRLAALELGILAVIALVTNISPTVRAFLGSITLTLNQGLGLPHSPMPNLDVPLLALLLIVALALVFGRIHFRLLGDPTETYAKDWANTAVGTALYPTTIALTNFALLTRAFFGFTQDSVGLFLVIAGVMIFSGLIGGLAGFRLAQKVRAWLPFDWLQDDQNPSAGP